MTNLQNIQRVAHWHTTKVAGGFKVVVSSCDYQVTPVLHFTAVYPTRAQAMGAAKKGVRYIRSLQVA